MEKTIIIGLDLAKNVFQAHGAKADGSVAFRKKPTRNQVLAFFAEQPAFLVAMEACASAHHWARSIRDLGHEVRLIPPIYVKPFVKRQSKAEWKMIRSGLLKKCNILNFPQKMTQYVVSRIGKIN